MAEPPPPQTDENGDRPLTEIGGASRSYDRLLQFSVVAGVAFLLFLFLWGGEEEEAKEAPPAVQGQEIQGLLPPLQEAVIGSPPLTVPATQPVVSAGPDREEEFRRRAMLEALAELEAEMARRLASPILMIRGHDSPPPAPAEASTAPAPPRAGGSTAIDGSWVVNSTNAALTPTAIVAPQMLVDRAFIITEATIIPGTLETAIQTDLPGMLRAIVSDDVYGHDGSQLLIPRGTRLIGRYVSGLLRGQTRVFVIWTRLIRPDGLSLQVASPGIDGLGRAGLDGDLDTHFFQIFGASILMSIIEGGIEVGVEQAREAGDNSTTVIQGDRSLTRASEIALERSIDIPPTIHVDQGVSISVMVQHDLDFRGALQGRDARE